MRVISWYVVLWICCRAIFAWSCRFCRGPAKTPLALAGNGLPADRRVPCALAASGQAHRWPAAWLRSTLLLNVGTSSR
jgi:hypothetical protein